MRGPMKNIAVFIDGTWMDATSDHTTNVRKLFEYTKVGPISSGRQVTYYIPGVGTKAASSCAGSESGR